MPGELKKNGTIGSEQCSLNEIVELGEMKMEELRAWINHASQEVEVIDDDDYIAVREAQSMAIENAGDGGPCITVIKHPPIETPSIIDPESIVCGEDANEFVEQEVSTEVNNSEICRELNRIYEDIISDW